MIAPLVSEACTLFKMNVSEAFLEIIFNIVKYQNASLLNEVAIRENIPVATLMKEFTPSKRKLREFIRRIHQNHSNVVEQNPGCDEQHSPVSKVVPRDGSSS